MSIRELVDGEDCELVALVREHDLRTTRDGRRMLRLVLGDRTGRVPAIAREDAETLAACCERGGVVRVRGRYAVDSRYGPQIHIGELTAVEPDERDLERLLDGPLRAVDQMEADLRTLVDTLQSPWLRRLLDALLGPDGEVWERFRVAPAAKFFHQAYRHGLLEHSLTAAESVSAIAATFPGIDRDLAVAGALLHDIGKLDAYTSDPRAIEMTDLGKLCGEIPLGYYRIRRAIEEIEGFPPVLAEALAHIVLAHHGSLEHGSPVVPATREATLVHMIDNLGGRLGSFDRLEKGLAEGRDWSGYDRALGGGAWFGPRAAA